MVKTILTPEDFKKIAQLCLAAAATTNLDEFGGERRHRLHHTRRTSFLSASSKLVGGVKLSDLGLSEEEMGWAIEHTNDDLQNRLRVALETMRSAWKEKERIQSL